VANIREPLLVLDKNLRIKTANSSFYKTFRVNEPETEGVLIYDLGNKQWNIPKLRTLLEKILPEKSKFNDFEVKHTFSNIGEMVMLLNAREVINKNSSEKLILLSIEDITERKKAEQALIEIEINLEKLVKKRTQALREANQLLKISNQNLEQFAYVASHDLQEPLRKIQTFSERLSINSDEKLSGDTSLYLKKITDAADRMTMLINALLDYSRLSDHEQVFVKTNLNVVLKNIQNDFDLLISQKNALINSKDLPEIEAIPLQMNQLFYNLISNSLKFSRENISPVINITCRNFSHQEAIKHHLDPKLSYCEIIFTDNGIGFNQEYAGQIFVIFQRLNG
ncbi:MAG: PAS domain S-box protein, partial [Bacteroidota bacterium]|nr:PAS domain S-box protein [Bacteroidota bacterium]